MSYDAVDELHGKAPSSSLTFAEFRKANVARCEQVFHKLDDWSLTDWATALAGEVGEACNIIKKLRRLDDGGVDAREFRDHRDLVTARLELIHKLHIELADVQAYLDLLSAAAAGNLGEDTRAKFNEVSRKRGSTIFL